MKDKSFLIENGIKLKESLDLFGDMETYNEALRDFNVNILEKLNELMRCKEVSDMPNYSILVHSLKK